MRMIMMKTQEIGAIEPPRQLTFPSSVPNYARVLVTTFSVICLAFIVLFFTGVLVSNPLQASLTVFLYQGIIVGATFLVYYVSGLLVQRRHVRVNYTRKVNHFAVFFLPYFLDIVFHVDPFVATVTTGITILCFVVFTDPIRKRSAIVDTMFAGFDRPEDRPDTTFLLLSQGFAGMVILGPFAILFAMAGRPELTLIISLINGIGDGLAEPIGIRFGAHTYKTRALFSKKKHIRSVEGSACVLVTSIAVLFAFLTSFTPVQFLIAVLSIPVTMTIMEAIAPHTWDNPFLFLTCGLLLMAISFV
jgi:dolichol kinase